MRDPVLFVLLAVLAAAWVTTHIATFVSVVRSKLSVVLRVLAVLPPLTPVFGIMAGAYWRSGLWIVTAAAYAIIRWGIG